MLFSGFSSPLKALVMSQELIILATCPKKWTNLAWMDTPVTSEAEDTWTDPVFEWPKCTWHRFMSPLWLKLVELTQYFS